MSGMHLGDASALFAIFFPLLAKKKGKLKRTGRAVSPVNFLEREGGEVNTSADSQGRRVFPLGTKQFIMTAPVIGDIQLLRNHYISRSEWKNKTGELLEFCIQWKTGLFS